MYNLNLLGAKTGTSKELFLEGCKTRCPGFLSAKDAKSTFRGSKEVLVEECKTRCRGFFRSRKQSLLLSPSEGTTFSFFISK